MKDFKRKMLLLNNKTVTISNLQRLLKSTKKKFVREKLYSLIFLH